MPFAEFTVASAIKLRFFGTYGFNHAYIIRPNGTQMNKLDWSLLSLTRQLMRGRSPATKLGRMLSPRYMPHPLRMARRQASGRFDQTPPDANACRIDGTSQGMNLQ